VENKKGGYMKNQRIYKVKLQGVTDMLMHRDNIIWGERIKKWAKDPANKKQSVAGDDRTPAWSWLGYLYHNSGQVVIDSDNIMSMLRDGGKKCPAPTGKGSMKAQTQSGIICNELGWPIQVNGKNILAEPLLALADEEDFEKHIQTAQENNIELFVKRARVGQAKHVRVRPRFTNWTAEGTVTVVDQQITKAMLEMILTFAGVYCGVGDWRPSSPKSPGQFGQFEAMVSEE
jgi:hypothetical protein